MLSFLVYPMTSNIGKRWNVTPVTRRDHESEICSKNLLRQNFGRTEKFHSNLILKPLQRPLQSMNTVPQGHEGDAEEETKGSSELGDKRRPRIDKHLSLHIDVVGHCVEAEQEVVCFENWRNFFSNEPVLEIVTRLSTASPFIDSFEVFYVQFTVELLISPIYRIIQIWAISARDCCELPVLLDFITSLIVAARRVMPGKSAPYLWFNMKRPNIK